MKLWLAILLCLTFLGLAAPLNAANGVIDAPLVVSTTVVWDTLDANGRSDGFITAKQESNGDWTWERYERQADGTHAKVDAGTATLSSNDPIEYSWTSSETEHTGTAKINADGSTGTWNDTTAGTSRDIKKSS